MTCRFAIYYILPPSSAFCRFGADVIGYDCFEAVEVAHTRIAGVKPNVLKLITIEPRRWFPRHAGGAVPFGRRQ